MSHVVCLVPDGSLGADVVSLALRIDADARLYALPGASVGRPLPAPALPYETPPYLAQSGRVLEALCSGAAAASVVVAPLAGAPAFLSLLARRQGLALEGTAFVLVDGGTVRATLDQHRRFLPSPEAAECSFAEETCRSLAEAVLAPGEAPPRQGTPSRERAGTGVPPERTGVCIVHHDRPEYLEAAVGSYEAQSVSGFSLVVVDNGSRPEALQALRRLEERLSARRWRILEVPEGSVGRARNLGAEALGTEMVLFADDDNLAKPTEVETMLSVAGRTGAEVVTCAMDTFTSLDGAGRPVGRGRVAFAGGALSGGVGRNCFGDNNALWRAEAFFGVGGYRDLRAYVHCDYELFARAVLAGARLEAIPFALFWYRDRPRARTEVFPWEDFAISLRPFREAMPHGLEDLPEMALGAWAARVEMERRQQRPTPSAPVVLGPGGSRGRRGGP